MDGPQCCQIEISSQEVVFAEIISRGLSSSVVIEIKLLFLCYGVVIILNFVYNVITGIVGT